MKCLFFIFVFDEKNKNEKILNLELLKYIYRLYIQGTYKKYFYIDNYQKEQKIS